MDFSVGPLFKRTVRRCMSENAYIIKYIKAVKLPVLLKVKNDKYFSCNGRSTEQYGCPSNLSSKSINQFCQQLRQYLDVIMSTFSENGVYAQA